METDLLAELIRQKHDCLVQLRQLARQQLALIDRNDMGNLLTVLATKQSLLSRLQETERQLEPFRDQDPERRAWRAPRDRQRCAAQAQRAEAVLAEILMLERQGETALVQRRDQTATRLDGAHSASMARQAYGHVCDAATGQLDLISDS